MFYNFPLHRIPDDAIITSMTLRVFQGQIVDDARDLHHGTVDTRPQAIIQSRSENEPCHRERKEEGTERRPTAK